MAESVAALDCGSNSTRLLVVGADGRARRREMRITRLGEGVDAAGTLAAPALARTYAVLDDYRAIMDQEGVARGLLVATSAVRDASNGREFLDEAARRSGVAARILSGREEAAYSYAGATGDLEPDERPTAIVDVGGGSTELAASIDGELVSASLQLGCVRVTERALGARPADDRAIDATRLMIGRELDRAFGAVPALARLVGRTRLVGLAGTVATLAQLDARLARYDRSTVHHRRLALATVLYWRDRLAGETPAARLTHPGMVRGREDVLPAGLFVLAAVMARLGVSEVLSSESDILDGVAASLREA